MIKLEFYNKDFLSKINAIADGLDISAKEAKMRGMADIKDVCEIILKEAKYEAPFEDGDLEDSGKILRNGLYAYIIRFRVMDGDFNYAEIQHESFPRKRIKGKIKYLEDPFNRHKDKVNRRLEVTLMNILERNTRVGL
jgi:hypothetical protein